MAPTMPDPASFTAPPSAELRAAGERVLSICAREWTERQKWFHIGVAEYRRRREAGLTPWPAVKRLDDLAKDCAVPSRDQGRSITVRMIRPAEKELRGVYVHIHGGGWVLGNAYSHDGLLVDIANQSGFAVLSIEYRLAPEHASPAAENDCVDVARYLLTEAAEQTFTLSSAARRNLFIGGESAGGHLTALTGLALRDAGDADKVRGLVLSYGVYDMSGTPSVRQREQPLVLNYEDMRQFRSVYMPGLEEEELRHPSRSPLYAKLDNMPPAYFQVGTADLLLDDTLFMHARYLAAGNKATIDIVPGGLHGYATMNLPQLGPQFVRGLVEFFNAEGRS